MSAIFILLLLAGTGGGAVAGDITDDVLGLLVFKADITSDPTHTLSSWTEDSTTPCSWPRIACAGDRAAAVALAGASLSGRLSRGLLRLTGLVSLNLSANLLSGDFAVPGELLSLPNLRVLDLSDNRLAGGVSSGVFTQCRGIRVLRLRKNALAGALPDDIVSCSSLVAVDLSDNAFSGAIPASIWLLPRLRELDLSGNAFAGVIPAGIGVPSNSSLRFLNLAGNALSGEVPSWIGEMKALRVLDLSLNNFSGEIPAGIAWLPSLEVLRLAGNGFSGELAADIAGGCKMLTEINVSGNALAGVIPPAIGNCSSLTELDLSANNFSGEIPASLSRLAGLRRADLSRNSLSGEVPPELAALGHLVSFNVSHNNLSGELPAGPFFAADNPGLAGAGAVLPKPIVMNPNFSSDASAPSPPPAGDAAAAAATVHRKKMILSISTLIALAGVAAIAVGVVTITLLNCRFHSSSSQSAAGAAPSLVDDHYLTQSPENDPNSGKLVMFDSAAGADFAVGSHALLNKDCELGRGGFGVVYKTGSMAIKKLIVSSLVKSRESFEKEVANLGELRHRNLVGLKGYYWTSSLQLLIYEFVAGGNLGRRLHEGRDLSWPERLAILAGVADGVAYLHRRGVIHYNIKSSNVLVDGTTAKVADYGLAKLLPMLDRYVLSSKTQSALGYMAPEFAAGGVADITEKCDVYAFGVLVLETVAGRKPVEYSGDDVVVLVDAVRKAVECGDVEACIDGAISGEFPPEEAIPVVKLGLACAAGAPESRPEMAEAARMLEVMRRTAANGSPIHSSID